MGIEAPQLSSQAVVLPQEERVHAGQLQHLAGTGVTCEGTHDTAVGMPQGEAHTQEVLDASMLVL